VVARAAAPSQEGRGLGCFGLSCGCSFGALRAVDSHACAVYSQPIHGAHMYSFPFRNPAPAKWAAGIATYVGVGMYLPWFAFGFSQRKAGTPGW
jgi:hypothetical protein